MAPTSLLLEEQAAATAFKAVTVLERPLFSMAAAAAAAVLVPKADPGATVDQGRITLGERGGLPVLPEVSA